MRPIRIVLVLASGVSFALGCSLLVDSSGLSTSARDGAVGPDAMEADADADAASDGSTSDGSSVVDAASDVNDAGRDAMSPLGEWLFEELPPLDTSGNGHHARVLGSPTLALDGGVRGGGMVVTLPSDGVVVDSLALTAFPSSGSLAMMLWPEGARLDAGTPSVFDGWGPSRSHVFWRQTPSVAVVLQFALQSNTFGDAAAPYAWTNNYELAPQTWTHVTLTWDTVVNVAALYINRVEALRSGIIPGFAPTGQIVRFGGMAGRYDEVRLYDRVLSKEEVALLP